jgi:GH15 family glucan-1,4-alpha-glucosidase
MQPPSSRGYIPLRDYAAIGDCRGAALVARDGGIDWCCLGRFDAEPLLARLLDVQRGGHCSVRVTDLQRIVRAYEPDTNILRTEFHANTGVLVVTDFMPVARAPDAGPNAYTDLVAPGWLVRCIEAESGEIGMECAFRPTLGFSLEVPRLTAHEHGVDAGASWLCSDLAWRVDDGIAHATTRIAARERRYIAIGHGGQRPDRDMVDALLAATRAFWTEWMAMSRYRGPWRAMVERSALVLKLLTYSPTGASAAAPTTSLPEVIGGERNWDYRFCWIRDATLGSHALSALGYAAEAHELYQCLGAPLHRGVEDLQVMYGVGLEPHLEERTVPALEGYRGSHPVRVGNAAYTQRQLDLYGYLLEGACIHKRLGGELTPEQRADLARAADFVAQHWREPDMGVWEMRREPRHFVHSKAMCWVTLQRATQLLGEREGWVRVRNEILAAILTDGCRGGHLVQTFESRDPGEVDAALLQVPLLGVPIDGPLVAATRSAVERELAQGDVLRRYRGSDGVPGRDGAFLACSFWLVDCLLLEGAFARAIALFERLLAYANDVGLFSEEIDPATGGFLGNYPQAFTHFSLVNTAVSIELVRRHGPDGLAGGYADRVQRAAWAVHGWRGFLAHLATPGRRNATSSAASKWPAQYPLPERIDAHAPPAAKHAP